MRWSWESNTQLGRETTGADCEAGAKIRLVFQRNRKEVSYDWGRVSRTMPLRINPNSLQRNGKP